MLFSCRFRGFRAGIAFTRTAWAKETVSLRTVAAFERGEITPLPNNLSAMRRAFEKAGLRLLFDREGLASGVARQAADIEPSNH